MNHNLSELQDLYELSNRDSRSNYSVVSEDLGLQLLQLIQEYQPNPQDQALLELSKQKTVLEIDEKFKNSITNQTFIFPRKITERVRNKAKELSQILANSVQNKNFKRIPIQQTQTSTQFQESKNQMNQINNSEIDNSQIDFCNLQDNDNSDDSFSSLQECTFYDLNSQKIYNQHPKSTQLKQSYDQQHDFYQNDDSQELIFNQQQVKQVQKQGNLQKHSGMINSEFSVPIDSEQSIPNNINKEHQQTQFVKQKINQHSEQKTMGSNYNQQQIEGKNEQQKVNLNKYSSNLKNLNDNELVDIQIQQIDIQGRQFENQQNNENQDLTLSGVKLAQNDFNQQGLIKNQKALLNNLVQSSSNPKKLSTKIQNNEQKEFLIQSINTNVQLNNIDHTNQYKIQRKPLTETSPNSKNLNYLNQTETIQGVSSSGVASAIKEQIPQKNKGSIHTSTNNKSDNNLKNSKIQFVQSKGTFTETDEYIEDALLDYTQNEDVKQFSKIKKDQEVNQNYKEGEQNLFKQGNIMTEGDLISNPLSKQFYNIPPPQSLNGKIRKLKLASFHQQKEQQKQKINQSNSIHYNINFNNNNFNIPNLNSFLPPTSNQPLSVSSKTYIVQPQIEKMNFSSNKGANNIQQQKKPLNSSFQQSQQQQQQLLQPQYTLPHDLDDIQVNLSQSTKNGGDNQQSIYQLNNLSYEQKNNLNKILNYSQTASYNNNNQKYLTFSQEGKLIKSIQLPNQTGKNNINSHNLNNSAQNAKFINTSLDQQRFENRFTPLRSNKNVGQQNINRPNQSQQASNTFNNFTNEDNSKNQNEISKSNTKSRNKTYLSTSKGQNQNENQQQGFTPTSSQANQLNKRNKTSIRKLRPKINTEGSFNDLSDLLGTASKECHFTQQIDPIAYLQTSKHGRNLTLNSQYLKQSTTKSSHQRQPSDNVLRSSIINRVFTDKSEDKIKITNMSQMNGFGGASHMSNIVQSDQVKQFSSDSKNKVQTEYNKIPQNESNSINNRFSSGNFNQIKRTLKLQSCKYNAQKNMQIQEQFTNTQQLSNNAVYQQDIHNQKEEEDILNTYKINMKNHNEQIKYQNVQQDQNKDINDLKQDIENRSQQDQKSQSQENRFIKLKNQIHATESNKKKNTHQNNQNSKSLAIAQPMTLNTFTNQNQNSHPQEFLNQNSSQNNRNLKINFQIKQDSNQNIKYLKKGRVSTQNQLNDSQVDNKNIGKLMLANKDSFEIKENNQIYSEPYQVAPNFYKIDKNQNNNQLINFKSEQLNQILQNAQQDMNSTKQQQNISNQARIKTSNVNKITNFEINQLNSNGNQLGHDQNSKISQNNENPIQETQYIEKVKDQHLQSQNRSNNRQDIEKVQNVCINQGINSTNTQQNLKRMINKTVGYSNVQIKEIGNNLPIRKPKALQITCSQSYSSNQQNINGVSGTGNLCAQATASSTQSNNSKNKSPLRLNFICNQNSTNTSYQKSQSTKHQTSVGLQKKYNNELNQSVSGQPQSIANSSTYN